MVFPSREHTIKGINWANGNLYILVSIFFFDMTITEKPVWLKNLKRRGLWCVMNVITILLLEIIITNVKLAIIVLKDFVKYVHPTG